MTTTQLITFLGGIGLFLLGMRLMTEGLKVAAGPGLRDLLARGTTSRARAVASGFTITALVQSSSAVTFATIGFVNAGLLALPAAIGVIYGANLGTTVTSWLVALVGFKFDLKALALPAIAAGMAMRVGFGARREGAFGEALAGIGVFFLGIDVLKDAFSGMTVAVPAGEPVMGHRLLPFVGVGLVMTLVMQSSSAALVVTLSAAASGVLPLAGAAAMVVGANVGTTSTAVFAVIGATAAAKRAAAAHAVFNLVVALIAILALPWLLGLIGAIGAWVHAGGFDAATALAFFHTLTNLIGLVVLWPVTGLLTRWLEARFRRTGEDPYIPRYLDRNIAATPALALEALTREQDRALELARRLATRAITVPLPRRAELQADCDGLGRLVAAIGEFTAQVSDPDRAELLARALRVNQYLDDVAERTQEFLVHGESVGVVGDTEIAASLQEINTNARAALSGLGDPPTAKAAFESHYQVVKSELLRAGAAHRMPVRQMVDALDQISALRRLVDQFTKASLSLDTIQRLSASKSVTA